MDRILYLTIGGALGANARYWIAQWLQAKFSAALPLCTFIINVTGSFLIGIVVALWAERAEAPNAESLRILFGTGFLGAYTTFSAFEYEIYSFNESGRTSLALLYCFGSLIFGFIGVAAGLAIGRRI